MIDVVSVGNFLDRIWPPNTWIILLGVRLLNFVIISVLIYELIMCKKKSITRRLFLTGFSMIWIDYFLRLYITPEVLQPANLGLVWLNLWYVVVEGLAWQALRRERRGKHRRGPASSRRSGDT